MTHRILTLVWMAALGASVSAQTALEPIASRVWAQKLVLPTETTMVSLTPGDPANPRTEYTMERTFAADGSFTVEWKNARYQSVQKFRADGTQVSGRQVDLARGLTLETQTDPGRSSLRTVITEKGAVKSDKKTAMKPWIVQRGELQYLNIQAWNAGIHDELTLQSLSPDGGMVGDSKVVFRRTADPTSLSDKYDYPAEFKAGLANRGPYVVADMSLQGIAAVFFPHHFYLVYTQGAQGLEFFAYFGEGPQKPVYQFLKK